MVTKADFKKKEEIEELETNVAPGGAAAPRARRGTGEEDDKTKKSRQGKRPKTGSSQRSICRPSVSWRTRSAKTKGTPHIKE
jgi:hypothetical protein